MNGGVGELVVELELVHLNSSSFAKCGMVCVDERQCLVYMLGYIVVSVLCVLLRRSCNQSHVGSSQLFTIQVGVCGVP